MTTTDRYKTEDNSAPGERRIAGHLMCMAKDCPLRASVNLGGGWLCSAHAFVSASRWPKITETLHTQEARDARWAIASLRFAIARRDASIPQKMRALQNSMMALGATVDDVKLRPMTDWRGEEFQEPPEHFANRMDFCMTRLIAPEDEPKPKAQLDFVRVEKTVRLDALAATVEEDMI